MFQIRWLWQNTDKSRAMFVIAMVISAVTSVAPLINPFLTSILIDEVIVAKNTKPLIPLLLGILTAQALRLAAVCDGNTAGKLHTEDLHRPALSAVYHPAVSGNQVF